MFARSLRDEFAVAAGCARAESGKPSFFDNSVLVLYQVASGWREPAGFPHARTFARADDHITVGEIR
jgi:hypothetical protein